VAATAVGTLGVMSISTKLGWIRTLPPSWGGPSHSMSPSWMVAWVSTRSKLT